MGYVVVNLVIFEKNGTADTRRVESERRENYSFGSVTPRCPIYLPARSA